MKQVYSFRPLLLFSNYGIYRTHLIEPHNTFSQLIIKHMITKTNGTANSGLVVEKSHTIHDIDGRCRHGTYCNCVAIGRK